MKVLALIETILEKVTRCTVNAGVVQIQLLFGSGDCFFCGEGWFLCLGNNARGCVLIFGEWSRCFR
jgi:hypothetical protein